MWDLFINVFKILYHTSQLGLGAVYSIKELKLHKDTLKSNLKWAMIILGIFI